MYIKKEREREEKRLTHTHTYSYMSYSRTTLQRTNWKRSELSTFESNNYTLHLTGDNTANSDTSRAVPALGLSLPLANWTHNVWACLPLSLCIMGRGPPACFSVYNLSLYNSICPQCMLCWCEFIFVQILLTAFVARG